MTDGPGPEQDGAAQPDDGASAPEPGAAGDSVIGQVLAGRYRVEGVLAKGGVGAVYVGTHVHMRKRVAIKLLHPEMSNLPELVQRFERESIVGAHANHPNVAAATDFGTLDDGSYYLVLEYVDGITLHDLLRQGPVPLERAVDIARQIASGLDGIHKQGIVHRDLKPRNVMVVAGDADQVKLVDFGFARLPMERFASDRAKAAALTSQGVVFGTPGYMAPELTFGMHAVKEASDLYALGVMLYEMLTGKHPYDKREGKELFACHQLEPPPDFRTRAPERTIPRSLEKITMRLLEKAPDDRYPNAPAVIDALDAARVELAEDEDDAVVSVMRASEELQIEKPKRRVEPKKRGDAAADATADSADADAPTRAVHEEDEQPPPPPRPARRRATPFIWLALAALVGVALAVKLVPGLGDRVLGTKDAATTSAPSSAPPPDSAAATPSATASAVPSAVASSAPTASASEPPPERPTIVDGFDGAGWREQLRKAVKWSDGKMATQAVLALCAIDPQSLTERALLKDVAQALVQAALGDAAAADEVFARLGAEDTGSAGPDVLYQLVVSHAGTKAAERANALLARPEILARATPAMKVALDLIRASCADKPQHFEAVAKDGDHRSLMQLLDLRPPRCNDLGSGCCLGHDPRYRDALNALGARVTGN